MKIFIKTSNICQESNLTKGPTNYILFVRDDRLDSSYITFRQNTFRQFIETSLLGKGVLKLTTDLLRGHVLKFVGGKKFFWCGY